MEKNNIPREQSEEDARREFEKHIESAGLERSEAERLKSLWSEIGSLPEEEPDENLRRRFDAMVAAYKAGMSHPETECANRRPRASALYGRFANHPVLSAAAVLLLFLVGGYAGYSLKDTGIPVVTKPESINKMRADVRQMDQVVMLSLMEQSQVTSRLKGVMYAYRIDNPDNSVLEALLHAVKNDPNTNVRLAAVDALYRYGSRDYVKNQLAGTLELQDSPMVQIALIDLITTVKEKSAVGTFERMLEYPNLNNTVRSRLVSGIKLLKPVS